MSERIDFPQVAAERAFDGAEATISSQKVVGVVLNRFRRIYGFNG